MSTGPARTFKGAIFDLDGVLVDIAKLYFEEWLRLAKELEIPFTEADNELLKDVSRDESLNILLSLVKVLLPAASPAASARWAATAMSSSLGEAVTKWTRSVSTAEAEL